MAVTSANLTGQPPATTVVEAATQLGAAVSVYLDGGPTTGTEVSTIVDCTGEEPVVLRAGAISQEQIDEVLEPEPDDTVGRARRRPTGRRAATPPRTGADDAIELPADPPVDRTTQHPPRRPPMSADTFYGSDFGALESFDPEIAGVLVSELDRIRGGLQLIASENMSSPEVLTALGSTLSNKYAEGYPGRRYYGGCSEVDKAETLAIERCKALFDADHANVQPHSGASANQAVYGAFMQPGDTILAMALPMGGHLTHGTKVSFSGKWFNAVHYGVDKQTEDIDYAEVERLAKEHRPKVILAGGSAIPRLIDFEFFRKLADEIGAIFWVDAAHFIGLVAGKAIPSPVPHADVVTFTTHKVLRGPRSGALVCKEEHAAKLDKAVFPMMQGGPQMHTIAAKAVNFKECATAGVPGRTPSASSRTPRSSRPRWATRESVRPPAAPTPTCRCTTCRAWASPAPMPRRAPTRPASCSTRTPSPSTRRSPTSPAASGSAPPASPPRAWARRRWSRSPSSSPRPSRRATPTPTTPSPRRSALVSRTS